MLETDDNASGSERDSDIDLYGVNIGYQFDTHDAMIEGYWFYKHENYATVLTLYDVNNNATTTNFDENKVYTVGARGTTQVLDIENLTLNAEIAMQTGTLLDQDIAQNDIEERDRDGLMADVGASYTLADIMLTPALGVGYTYLSGEEVSDTNEALDSSDFNAWDPMYRGKTTGNIRDCLENLYPTNNASDTSGWTNQHSLKATCGLDLAEYVDGLSLDLAYMYYWFDEEPAYESDAADDEIGSEVNVKLTYDYTEDVEFVLAGDVFIPGDYYDTVGSSIVMTGGGMTSTTASSVTNRVANDEVVSIIGSCKVSF
jgi:hypothetical protein